MNDRIVITEKDLKKPSIKNIYQWDKPIDLQGIYRFRVYANMWFEIHINYRKTTESIYKAKASLYVVGEFDYIDSGLPACVYVDRRGRFFQRKLLVDNKTVKECVDEAIAQYNKIKGKL